MRHLVGGIKYRGKINSNNDSTLSEMSAKLFTSRDWVFLARAFPSLESCGDMCDFGEIVRSKGYLTSRSGNYRQISSLMRPTNVKMRIIQ